jgi:predicted nucleic acid-binding protein
VVARRRAIADTSLFIGLEARRFDSIVLADLDLAVSVITLGELRLGVVSAGRDPEAASQRLAAYELARQFEPLPIDEQVSDAWAVLVAKLRVDSRKAPINDTWIAATALAHEVPLVTQDNDYDPMPGLTVIKSDEISDYAVSPSRGRTGGPPGRRTPGSPPSRSGRRPA